MAEASGSCREVIVGGGFARAGAERRAGPGDLLEVFLGVNAAGKSLEGITRPLTATDQPAPATQAASTTTA